MVDSRLTSGKKFSEFFPRIWLEFLVNDLVVKLVSTMQKCFPSFEYSHEYLQR